MLKVQPTQEQLKNLSEVPAQACLFSSGGLTFSAVGDSKTVPITILARSAEPIDHWFWGHVIHDMAGMKVHKDRLPIDYLHSEEIGYLDSFEVDAKKGLTVSGALVLTGMPGDTAATIVARQKGGVPYEASIFFSEPMTYEYVDERQFAEVNGAKFEGPGVVIRNWQLRGVAICPYGADMNTESQFEQGRKVAVSKYTNELRSAPDADGVRGFASTIRFGGGIGKPKLGTAIPTTPNAG